MHQYIAIVGWGSLIWNPKELPLEGDWSQGGPMLPIEFSRVSKDGRLTLVVDPKHGEEIATYYAKSLRNSLDEAVEDLRSREGALTRSIGFTDMETGESSPPREGTQKVTSAIREWAERHSIGAVVWTDLPSNFEEKCGHSYSVERAISYLSKLEGEEQKEALRYIRNAPAEVDTPLRRAFEGEQNQGLELR